MAAKTLEGSMTAPKLAGSVPHTMAGAAPKVALPKVKQAPTGNGLSGPAVPNPLAAPLVAPGMPGNGINSPGATAPGMMPNLQALLKRKAMGQ